MSLPDLHIVEVPVRGEGTVLLVQEPYTLPSGHTLYRTIFMSYGLKHLNKWLELFGTEEGFKRWNEDVRPSLGHFEHYVTVWDYLDRQ